MVSELQIYLLGAIAGFTIFLGLPLALIPNVSNRVKAFLNSISIGILVFLLIEIMEKVFHEVEEFSEASILSNVYPLSAIIFAFALGLIGLNIYEKIFLKNKTKDANYIALVIAIGIGLHNLSEGLAIGGSYVQGAISFALLLVIGFGLHNMTEGFGIAGPLSGKKPSLIRLAFLGLIAGGPTFIGTIIGTKFSSVLLNTVILALAGGAILYVIKELLHHGRKDGEEVVISFGIFLGIALGLATEIVLELSLHL